MRITIRFDFYTVHFLFCLSMSSEIYSFGVICHDDGPMEVILRNLPHLMYHSPEEEDIFRTEEVLELRTFVNELLFLQRLFVIHCLLHIYRDSAYISSPSDVPDHDFLSPEGELVPPPTSDPQTLQLYALLMHMLKAKSEDLTIENCLDFPYFQEKSNSPGSLSDEQSEDGNSAPDSDRSRQT